MDQRNPSKPALTRTLVAGLLVFALLQTTRTADALAWLTRPAVLAVTLLFGGSVSDAGDHLVVDTLRIPWSRDCAGFDVLVILWGLIIWNSRNEPMARRFWLRMATAVPAAVVANIARVLTIIAWRKAFYPAIESPQMHYFIGFLWLLPLLVLFIPRRSGAVTAWLAGMIMPAAALSLAAPQVSAPGGFLVSGCTILLLAVQRFHRLGSRLERFLAGLWLLAAIGVAGAGMESLWLPWLLACPWYIPRSPRLCAAAVLLPGTVPLFVMSFPWITGGLMTGTVIFLAWSWSEVHGPAHGEDAAGALTSLTLGLAVLVPFFASTLGPVLQGQAVPPSGLMAQPLEHGTWRLRVPRQSPYVSLTWFAPSGSGRHHTLPVCLSYRGRTLNPDPSWSGLFSDDELWLAERFLMPDGELCDYPRYLHRTLVPFSSPGVHLIASARRDRIDASMFRTTALQLFTHVADCARRTAAPPENPTRRTF